MAIGEMTTGRYVRHAPASASGPLCNGEPVSSNRVMNLLVNNVAVLERESVRHLVRSGGLTPKFWAAGEDPRTAGTIGAAPSTTTWASDYQLVFPDRRSAARFGVTVAVGDVLDATTGQLRPRTIRMRMALRLNTSSTAQVVFAVTSTSDPRALFGGSYLAISSTGASGTALQYLSKDLTIAQPIENVPYGPAVTCRPAGSTAAAATAYRPLWLWFMWGASPLNGIADIASFDAWEIR